jgi:hypothetical protein
MNDRRLKLLRVHKDYVLALALGGARIIDDHILAVSVEGLPVDVKIDAVSYDQDRDCFVFRLWHASFDVVPDFHVLPEIEPRMTMTAIPLPTEQRGYRFL